MQISLFIFDTNYKILMLFIQRIMLLLNYDYV